MNMRDRGIDTLGRTGLCLLLALGFASRSMAGDAMASHSVASWVTTADHSRALAPADTTAFGSRSRLPIHIEVDGKAFHTDLDGARCKEDLTRDHYLIQRGWVVLRFWAVEVRDRLDACVERVLNVRATTMEKKIGTASSR